MKHDIANLVTFFKGLSILIEHVVDKRVRVFVNHIKGDFSTDDSGGTDADSVVRVDPQAKIGDFRLVDAEREFLYRTVVTIRSFFSLFADVANMWIDMSAKNITPGMKILDSLGKTTGGANNDPAAMQKKVAELEAWSDVAVKDVEITVGKVRLLRPFDKVAAD